jgi:cation diffusion facilitator CzcD-associated flavoprotein CzcO
MTPRIAVIGAGPGGLCTGIRLREAGYQDFVILEKAAGVGGTMAEYRDRSQRPDPGAWEVCRASARLTSTRRAPD